MNFFDALNRVINEDVIVGRKCFNFDGAESECPGCPWSEWKRIRMEEDHDDFDSIIFIEENNWEETDKRWILEWSESILSKADIQADNWKIMEE